jgi:hypothetical protein
MTTATTLIEYLGVSTMVIQENAWYFTNVMFLIVLIQTIFFLARSKIICRTVEIKTAIVLPHISINLQKLKYELLDTFILLALWDTDSWETPTG